MSANLSLTDEVGLRVALLKFVDEIVPQLMRPSDLYDEGTEELIAQYGGVGKIPVGASVDNEKMTEAYNEVPHLIIDSLFQLRNILTQHLGPTGAQMGFADGQLFAKSIGYDGPMRIIKADTYLYPQYVGKITEWLASPDIRQYLAERAQEALLSKDGFMTEGVRTRMEAIAMSSSEIELTP